MPNRWAGFVLNTGSILNSGCWCLVSRTLRGSEGTNRAWDGGPWCWRWFNAAFSHSRTIRRPVVLGVMPRSVVSPSAAVRVVSTQVADAWFRRSLGAPAQHARAADRCAHKIVRFLTRFGSARRLTGNSLGGWGSVVVHPVVVIGAGLGCAHRWRQARRAQARCAGVVRRLVVRIARCVRPDRVLGVVLIEARCAGVVLSQCGAVRRAADQRHAPARPTRPCTRPLRARDRGVFERQIRPIVIAIAVGGG